MRPDLTFLAGQSVMVTGGTGSFGQAFVRTILEASEVRRVVVYSRDEQKQYRMEQDLGPLAERVRFFIGDVRDLPRLEMAMRDMNYVVHAAALKHVPACEYNPLECIKTNIGGAENIVRAALQNRWRQCVIALSTDKACNPINIYGASKLAAEKIFVHANVLRGHRFGPCFSVVRYGNVVNSNGSVIPYFRRLLADGVRELPITHRDMTRFWITLKEAVDFVLSCFAEMSGGEIFVPKLPSMKITALASLMSPGMPFKIVGIRPGEKLHETLVTEADARACVERGDRFVIGSPVEPHARTPEDFRYTSDSNPDRLHGERLAKLLEAA
jgi:UDP-N-acetylglucosamine 4,6-dehydratase